MAGLGLVHVRGQLCKYQSKSAGNRRASSKAGKFVRCHKAGKRGWAAVKSSSSSTPSKRKSGSRKGVSCTTVYTKMFGQGSKRKCRTICRRKGKIVSNTPCRKDKKRR